MTSAVDSSWQRIQLNTLTNWINDRLRGNLRSDANVTGKVEDLSTDLQDGLLLIRLCNCLAKPKKIKRFNKKPIIKLQKLENLSTALKFLQGEGVKFVNIGAFHGDFHPLSGRG
jgi:hypothetical protein